MNQVSTAHFDYRNFTVSECLPAFRQMTASFFEIWPVGDPEDFQVEAFGYEVGELLFNDVEFSASRFRRGQSHMSDSNKDFLMLQAQLAGGELLVMNHGVVRLLPGNIYLRDWAHPFESTSTPSRIHTIVIPRHRLVSSTVLAENNPVVSWSMSEPGGGLLFTLWSDLMTRLPYVSRDQAEVMCRAFLGFIDGLLGHGIQQESPATLAVIENFILAKLRSTVNSEDLCRHFNISRSSLYRLFEPHGGVRAFVSRKRMEYAYTDLLQADPQHVRVGEVAASWGFTEASAFSRRFRQQFGVSPSDVLGDNIVDGKDAVAGINHDSKSYRNYMSWLRRASNNGLKASSKS
jgi:AraC-like DNA-binding protein